MRARVWRNLEPLVLRPSAAANVLSGRNGQGKTNIIEAIYFLATLRSFRTSHVRELVRDEASAPRTAARGWRRTVAAAGSSASWRSRWPTGRGR